MQFINEDTQEEIKKIIISAVYKYVDKRDDFLAKDEDLLLDVADAIINDVDVYINTSNMWMNPEEMSKRSIIILSKKKK